MPFPTSRFARRHRLRSPRDIGGFTLFDALLGMTIAFLLFGIAVPNYRDAVAQTHATAARSAMTMTLFDAMRDATIHGHQVVVCPSPGGTACTNGTDWSRGWIAFIDLNNDRLRGVGEPLTDRRKALQGDVHLHSTQGRPRIVFQPNGSNAGSNVTFTLCDRRGHREALRLVLANNGRLRALPAQTGPALACTSGL